MATVQTTVDRVGDVLKSIGNLADAQVLVGIPATQAQRKDEDGKSSPISNAALGYIHEFGSPVRNIPARPFLRPGIEMARKDINERLRKAATAAIDGDLTRMMVQLNAAGMVAVNSVRRKITEGPFVPLAESTIRARRAKLRGTTALSAQQRAQGFVDIRPLIDTGQLRRAITYVIRKRGSNRDIGGKPEGAGGNPGG